MSPDLIDVVVPIGIPSVVIDTEILCRRKNPQRRAFRISHTQRIPRLTINSCLSSKVGTHFGDCIASDTESALVVAVGGVQVHSHGKTNEIDITDVGVNSTIWSPCKFDESPVDGRTWITRIHCRRLDKCWTIASHDSKELKVSIGKPDTTS